MAKRTASHAPTPAFDTPLNLEQADLVPLTRKAADLLRALELYVKLPDLGIWNSVGFAALYVEEEMARLAPGLMEGAPLPLYVGSTARATPFRTLYLLLRAARPDPDGCGRTVVGTAWVRGPDNREDASVMVQQLGPIVEQLQAVVPGTERRVDVTLQPDRVQEGGYQPKQKPLAFVEGGYILYGLSVDLPGKPLAVLKAIAESRTGRKSARALRSEVWNDETTADQNVKDAVKTARRSLRKAFRGLRIKQAPKDPIPCVDKGNDLAWKLDLPNPPDSTRNIR